MNSQKLLTAKYRGNKLKVIILKLTNNGGLIMIETSIGNIVKDIIIKNLPVIESPSNKEDNIIKDSSILIEDLGYDSIQFIQLIIDLEKEFNIEFNDEMILMESLSTIEKLISTIEFLVSQKNLGNAYE